MRTPWNGGTHRVDCTTCPVRGARCGDCMVTGIDAFPNPYARAGELPLDANEARVVGMLAGAGLISAEEAAGARATRNRLPVYPATG